MERQKTSANDSGMSDAVVAKRGAFEFEQQCLRILRCTARSLANSPGGLRFRAGTRPWLDAISDCHSSLTLSVQHGG